VDGSCEPGTTRRVREHLDSCSSCLAFYREQLELNQILGSEALELNPPEYLWYRIESRMSQAKRESTSSAVLVKLFRFWRVPKLRYALVSSGLLLAASWSLLQYRADRAADQLLLARIDAYQMNVQGNPFLSVLDKPAPPDNPFIDLSPASSNPFESKGNLQ